MSDALGRLLDMRRGEGPALARAAVGLFLLLSAHTVLETARDALLLSRLPSRDLGAVYIVAALSVLPMAMLTARLSPRLGVRRLLATGLVLSVASLAVLFGSPVSTASILAIYVVSCLVGAVLIPLYWSLLAGVFSMAQGRRLIAPVAAAGTLGAVSGSTAAAGLLSFVPVTALLLVSAGFAAITALVLPAEPPLPTVDPSSAASASTSREAFAEPFVRRVAWLVAASTAALVVLDFTFKWTVTRAVPHGEVARFVARYYAVVSGAGFLAQLLASRAVVQRLGVARTIIVVPLMLLLGGILAVVSAGAVPVVLGLKGVDSTLRYSVHRVTTELTYLPLPAPTRMRAKPIIDGAIVRLVQGGAGTMLLGAGIGGVLSPRALAAATVVALAAWLAAGWAVQVPYIAFLRRVISGGLSGSSGPDPLDVESAEALLAHLSSDDASTVVGAINVLARRRRGRMIPALILLHEDGSVLERALELFGASDRKDWFSRARTLLSDGRERVRMAAARALASHGGLRARDLASDASPKIRGYAALYAALERGSPDLAADPVLAPLLTPSDPYAEEQRLGVLSAIADAAPAPRLAALLVTLGSVGNASHLGTIELARAATAQRATALIPTLAARLTVRDGREALRAALVSFGTVALDALGAALVDPDSPRALRIHLPNGIARFGTKRAAELLLETIETDGDGLVRYKAIRALERLTAEGQVRVNRARVGRLAKRNLVEHFRLLGLRGRLDSSPLHVPTGLGTARAPTERLLVGILNDKLRQSLERTFRLLKIAHPEEDVHRVHAAYHSEDRRTRDSAVELLDTFLRKRDEAELAHLLRLAGEESSFEERLARSGQLLPELPPTTVDEALERLTKDADATVAALARLHVAALSGQSSRVEISTRERAPIPLETRTSAQDEELSHV
jgi:AAA family ATP:ADP antiporter